MPTANIDPEPLVTVIIVNYNGGEVVLRCLVALHKQRFRSYRTLVVDNNSTDNSALKIQQQFPWVRLLRLPNNKGFAAGVNYALAECKAADFVALLNPDAFPSDDWLDQLVTAANRHPEYAAFGCRMFSDKAMQELDGVGDVYHASGLPWRQGHGQPDSNSYDEYAEIFAPCAAAAMYRTDALTRIGGFDEDFFLYVEDVDVGFRLRLVGYKSLYVPAAKVWHLGSAIVGKHSDLQIYHGHRNLVWTFVKDMPGSLFWLLLPSHLALNVATLLWFCLRGRGRVILQSKWDAVKGLPGAWQKRKVVQSTRTVTTFSIASILRWNLYRRRYW